MRRTRWQVAVVASSLLLAGCTTQVAGLATVAASSSPDGDRKLVEQYFSELNASGEDGTSAQREFLQRTQHPDYTDRLCDLGNLTLRVDPAMSTFRANPDWVPPDSRATGRPRGRIYVLGVSVSIRQQGALLGEQIGSERVVVLDSKVYGFSPCPTE